VLKSDKLHIQTRDPTYQCISGYHVSYA